MHDFPVTDDGSDPLSGGGDRELRFAALGLPNTDDQVWSPHRLSRHAVLAEKSKELDGLLGRLYGTAVNLLPQLEVPGSMTLLAHCVREIYNRYPNFDGFAIPKHQASRDDAVRSLEKVWVTLDERLGDLEAGMTDGLADDPLFTVRQSIHVTVDAVVAAERAGSEAARERHRYWVNATGSAALGGNSGPSEDQAHRCVRFFVGYAHVGTTLRRFERVEVEQQFALFERLLDNRLREFLNASDEMAELLAEANTPRRTDGGGIHD